MSSIGPHSAPAQHIDHCPSCGETYDHRVRKSDDCFATGQFYRCEFGRYVYLHRMADLDGHYRYRGYGGDRQ